MITRRILAVMMALALLSNSPTMSALAFSSRRQFVRRTKNNKRSLSYNSGYSSNYANNYNSNNAATNNANNYGNQNNAYSAAYSNYGNKNGGNSGSSGNSYNRNGNSGYSAYSSSSTYSYSSSSASTTTSNSTSSNYNSTTTDGEYYETENIDDAYNTAGENTGTDDKTASNGNRQYNYLWQRDDDDDYYDSSSGYWASNKNLKAASYNGNDNGSNGYAGGQSVQHDDDASRSYGNGFDKSKTKKRGYFSQDDDEFDGNNHVGFGVLNQAERIVLAFGVAIGMTALLLFILFSPVILSSLSHCCGGATAVKELSLRKLSKREREAIKRYTGPRRRRSRSRSRALTENLADPEEQHGQATTS